MVGWMVQRFKQYTHDKHTLFTLIVLLIILFDQTTKYAVKLFLLDSEKVIIPKVLSFSHIRNYGASFGILQNQTAFLIWFSIGVVIAILWYFHKIPFSYLPWVALIFGGAVANLIDRLSYGFVIDFISVGFWPAFNVADSAITIGVLVLVWKMWRT